MTTDAGGGFRIIGEKDSEWIWGGLLIAVTIVLSGRFACAVPFAALAALAALACDRKHGLLLIAAIWLANQAVGFVFLSYPIEFQSIAWGLVLGISAVLSLFAARIVYLFNGLNAFVRTASALLFAFFAYEGSLYVASVVTASSEAAFSWPVMEEIAAINVGSFAVLLCPYGALFAAGLLRQNIFQATGEDFGKIKPETV